MRIMLKGGVWKNSEDEILKAAVMKYGKSKWSRVASLLNHKDPGDCKARWEEWLDPAIKKTEWTREEEEKLLFMCRSMTNAWRTISQMISGRTAKMCLDKYNELTDEQKRKDGIEISTDVRKLRPGEIDPDPETRPARPDPIDMDDDELEMLAQARARLQNTKGKKAKRKAREKQLQYAKRMTQLHKQRELSAAGIEENRKKFNKHFLNYNKEIPFQRHVPGGPFDTTDEDISYKKPEFKRVTIEEVEGRRFDVQDAQRRRDDAKKQRKLMRDDPESYQNQLAKATNRETEPELKRARLDLPSPQVSAQELDDIAYLQSKDTSAMIEGGVTGGGIGATAFNRAAVTPTPLRTPGIAGTPAVGGGMNTALRNLMETPSLQPNSTPLPSSGATPMASGLRSMSTAARVTSDSVAKKEDRRLQKMLKKSLRGSLKELPLPENEIIPQAPGNDDDEDDEEMELDEEMIEDAAEIEAREEAMRRKKEQEELEQRSTALKRSLPRPARVPNLAEKSKYVPKDPVSKLIRNEMVYKMRYEFIRYPCNDKAKNKKLPSFEECKKRVMQEAEVLIMEGIEEKGVDLDTFVEEKMKGFEDFTKKMTFNAKHKCYLNITSNKIPKDQKIQFLSEEFDAIRERIQKDATKCSELEKKHNVSVKPLKIETENLLKKITQVQHELDTADIELSCFEMLAERESAALPKRMNVLAAQLEELEEKEKELQGRYNQLLDESRTV
eukprot:TRINITY_DN530_c0_g2_i1.p1 TRINITY_DN530_c0_g2~~TRINITY_DN530_c0_g2_i1.p1  ORF type:complete len:727 (-),score=310.19 TRINITY_DN530_c0_g2_i1:163-2343(-)